MTARQLWDVNNGILPPAQRTNVETNSCQIGVDKCLQDMSQLTVPRFFCQPDPDAGKNQKILHCTCQNPGKAGVGQNGYTCVDDKGAIVNTSDNTPNDYCHINEVCKPGTPNDIRLTPVNGDTKFLGGVVIKGILCTQEATNASCTCKNPGKTDPGANEVDCTPIDAQGKATGPAVTTYCSRPELACNSVDAKTPVQRDNLKDGRTILPNSTLQGVTCDEAKAVCSCDTPGQLGKGTLKCTVNGKQVTGSCHPDLACLPETDGSKALDHGTMNFTPPDQSLDKVLLTGVQCKQAGLPGVVSPPTPTVPPVPPPPCAPGKLGADGVCAAFLTAFGEINTDAGGFLVRIFALLLSFSGGIALLLIMRAGYILMTSAGKPDRVTAGREQLVAAIVGLLFIIFSVVILQVIGVDILHLPGMTQ